MEFQKIAFKITEMTPGKYLVTDIEPISSNFQKQSYIMHTSCGTKIFTNSYISDYIGKQNELEQFTINIDKNHQVSIEGYTRVINLKLKSVN